MKKIVFVFLAVILFVPSLLVAQLTLSGLLRNDAYFLYQDHEPLFIDTLEARLIFSARKERQWLFYADARAYMYYGHVAGDSPLTQQFSGMVPHQGYTTAKINRAFVRLYSEIGDFTMGKTYINFGNGGFFNPFDIDRSVNFSDLGADREGILGFEYNLFAADFLEFKAYGGLYNFDIGSNDAEIPFGAELRFRVEGFEFGLAGNRLRLNDTVIGLFFKGDIEVGIQGAYGAHFDDSGTDWFHEANLGIDYSFFQGHLIVTAMVYYTSSGAVSQSNYPSVMTGAGFPHGMVYFFGDLTGVVDEFLRLGVSAFVNCIDGSTLMTPTVSWIVMDGLTLSLQVPFVIGEGGEFPEISGYSINNGGFGALVRVEGKF